MAHSVNITLVETAHACNAWCKDGIHADVGYADADVTLAELTAILIGVGGAISVEWTFEAPIPAEIQKQYGERKCRTYLLRWSD